MNVYIEGEDRNETDGATDVTRVSYIYLFKDYPSLPPLFIA